MKIRRIIASATAIAIGVSIISMMSGCGESSTKSKNAMSPVPIVTSLDKAGMTADGIAQYYMYCILRGDYDKAWNITYKPDELVFSEKLLKLKFEEFGVSTIEETVMPLGYGSGINKIYNDDGMLINKDGHLIDEDGNLIDEEGNFVDEDGNIIDVTESDEEASEIKDENKKNEDSTDNESEEEVLIEEWGNYGEATVNIEDNKLVDYGDFTYSNSCEEIPEKIMNTDNKWVDVYRQGIYMYGATVDLVDETQKVTVSDVTVYYGYDNAGYDVYSWSFKVRGSEESGFEVMTPQDFLNNETVKIKVPDGVKMKINGANVSSKLCGTDDYYVLTQYPGYSQIDVELSCVPLEPMTKKLDIIDTGEVTPDTDEFWNLANEDGELNKYELRWNLSKTEIKDIEKWIGHALQSVFNTVMSAPDISETTFGDTLWSKADKEAFKPQYLKAIKGFGEDSIYEYKDLSVMECSIWRDEDVQYEEVTNEVISNQAVNVHVKLKLSYIRENISDKGQETNENELEFTAQLTKEDKQWKFVTIPGDMLDRIM